MAGCNPLAAPDPLEALDLHPGQPPAALGAALAALDPAPAWGATARGVAATLLRWPWHVPTAATAEERGEAWVGYRQALAGVRRLWEREEEPEPGDHDAWVRLLGELLVALEAPALHEGVLELLVGAGHADASPADVVGAQADLLVDALLDPAVEWVSGRPARYPVEAAHLQVVRRLAELGERPEDRVRLNKRVLRAGGLLWLEVGRPERAEALLGELVADEPEAGGLGHYYQRARLLRCMAGVNRAVGGLAGAGLPHAIKELEALADEAPLHWEVRTQLADLYLHQARGAIERHRASEASEGLVRGMTLDMAWPPCAALAGDVEGSMHERKLVGGLGGGTDGFREAEASEQLRSAIRAGISRGEMYLSRERAWKLFTAWPQAEAAHLWHDLGLPLDGGTFPKQCLGWVEAVAEAEAQREAGAAVDEAKLRVRLRAALPQLPDGAIDGPVTAWAKWALSAMGQLGVALSAKDLLFVHRLRDRPPVATPLGTGPHYRPVLGFGLRETSTQLVVEGVRADGPGGAAGLRDGDVLTAVRGVPTASTERVLATLLGWQPGEEIPLQVQRGAEAAVLSLLPQAHRALESLPRAQLRRRFDKLLGLRVDPGLTVRGAPRVGMFCQVTEGDRVLRLEGQPVRRVEDLEDMLRTVDMGQFLLFTVQRGGQPRLAKVITLAFKE